MVEPILHVILPLLILLAFKPDLDKRLVFSLLILAILPDFDYFIGHRSLFHNVFFVVIFSIFIYFIFRFVINKNQLSKKKENNNSFYLSLYYLFFHLFWILVSPEYLFYPLTSKLFTFNFGLNLAQVADNTVRMGPIAFNSLVATQPLGEATKDQIVPLMTNLGFLLGFVIVVIFFVCIFRKLNRKTI